MLPPGVNEDEQEGADDSEDRGLARHACGAGNMAEDQVSGPKECRDDSAEDHGGTAHQAKETAHRGWGDSLRCFPRLVHAPGRPQDG